MPYPVATGAGAFIDSVLGVCLFIAAMRFIFQRIQADFDIPLVRFTVAVTNPPIRFLRRFIPDFGGMRGRDIAAALFVYLLAALKLTVPLSLAGYDFNWSGALLLAFADTLDTFAWVFLLAVLAGAVASWVFPSSMHPMIRIAYHTGSPILMPIREVLPPLAGIDFSPLVGLFALRLAQQWLIAPLAGFGLQLM
ncbi:MAG: YggT family protein [Gammaproteobacteria bacterium]|nr:YggT family protein [Gammaproteobacteria bacterium]